MFSPFYGPGGLNVPHPMFMSIQGVPSASGGYYFPPIHPFHFTPFLPNGYQPRFANGMVNGYYSNDGPPQLRKLFIGGLSHETTDEQLRQYYSQWGTVVDCIVIRDPRTKYSRGFGFVTYAAMHMAEAAMADRPHTINNKIVDPKRAIPREQMSPFLPNHPPYFLEIEAEPGCKLSLSGIHWAWHTVDDLRQHFDHFGVVEQVEILGNPRGLGFVVFEDKESADKCLDYGRFHVINGQKCEVTRNPIEHSIYQRNEVYSCDSNETEPEDRNNSSISNPVSPDNSEQNEGNDTPAQNGHMVENNNFLNGNANIDRHCNQESNNYTSDTSDQELPSKKSPKDTATKNRNEQSKSSNGSEKSQKNSSKTQKKKSKKLQKS